MAAVTGDAAARHYLIDATLFSCVRRFSTKYQSYRAFVCRRVKNNSEKCDEQLDVDIKGCFFRSKPTCQMSTRRNQAVFLVFWTLEAWLWQAETCKANLWAGKFFRKSNRLWEKSLEHVYQFLLISKLIQLSTLWNPKNLILESSKIFLSDSYIYLIFLFQDIKNRKASDESPGFRKIVNLPTRRHICPLELLRIKLFLRQQKHILVSRILTSK